MLAKERNKIRLVQVCSVSEPLQASGPSRNLLGVEPQSVLWRKILSKM